MSEKSPNLMLKYAIIGLIGGPIGVFISQYLGYNDGSMQAYLTGAIACGVGGAVGGMIRQRKGKASQERSILSRPLRLPAGFDKILHR